MSSRRLRVPAVVKGKLVRFRSSRPTQHVSWFSALDLRGFGAARLDLRTGECNVVGFDGATRMLQRGGRNMPHGTTPWTIRDLWAAMVHG